MRFFLPRFDGTMTVPRIPDGFFNRIAGRVRDGLFIRGTRVRANYSVRREEQYDIRFAAADLSTAINVGLNEVRVYRLDDQRVGYSVTFWKWTAYAIALSAVIALGLAATFLFWPSVGEQMARYGTSGRYLFWGMLVFWGVLWPWVLTAMHKPFAARCLENILREELSPNH